MTAQDFLSAVSQLIYLVLFAVTTARFVRSPSWASFDTFLFFGVIATLLLARDAAELFGFTGHPALATLTWVGVSALPLILLRLVDDFRPRPTWLMVATSTLFGIVAAVGILAPQPWPPAVTLVPVGYVVLLGGYASLAFYREAASSQGVTRRRMQAVALGSALLAVVLLLAGLRMLVPDLTDALSVVSQVLGLGTVLSYYAGFAPPAILRRAWQEPAIRAMLAEAPELVRLPDAQAIAARLRERALAATGGEGAAVGIWNEADGVLKIRLASGEDSSIVPGEYIAGRAFAAQRPILSVNPERDAPEHADMYRKSGVRAIAAAPITAGDKRLGVLVVYAARPPAFTDDALSLVEVLAEQAALVLGSHDLLREAAQVRALAEVTRMKDDFLSVVAHDVRTPLTTILINAELLGQALGGDGRNARRAASLHTEALRLKQLVEDYLDVVRAEQGREVRREPHDLAKLVATAVEAMGTEGGRVRLSADGPVMGSFDEARIRQLVENLVGNALKYSGSGAPVEVRVWTDDSGASISVTDHGIGIPEADLPFLFERFHRGSNTDDRRYGGLGLGLYICRQIAEEHGGTISVSSRVGEGTTFAVTLDPVGAVPAPPAGAD